MSWTRRGVRAARRAAGAAVGGAVRGPSPTLRSRFDVDPDWRRTEDGAAARLDHHTTIEVTRVGRWRQVDPLRGNDGWRKGWKAVGLLGWGAAVGVAWWLGASRGQGPLGMLRDDRPSLSGLLDRD